MNVREVMSTQVLCCAAGATVADAASIMWNRDCGVALVTDPATEKLVGLITDRDACMAGLTQGRPLHEIPVARAMSTRVVTIAADADVALAHELMRHHQIRRLPVVDARGELVGLLSITDVARKCEKMHGETRARMQSEVAHTLAVIGRPHALASTG